MLVATLAICAINVVDHEWNHRLRDRRLLLHAHSSSLPPYASYFPLCRLCPYPWPSRRRYPRTTICLSTKKIRWREMKGRTLSSLVRLRPSISSIRRQTRSSCSLKPSCSTISRAACRINIESGRMLWSTYTTSCLKLLMKPQQTRFLTSMAIILHLSRSSLNISN